MLIASINLPYLLGIFLPWNLKYYLILGESAFMNLTLIIKYFNWIKDYLLTQFAMINSHQFKIKQ